MRSFLAKLVVVLYCLVLTDTCVGAADPWSESYRLEFLGQYGAAAQVLEPFLKQTPVNEFAVLRHGWLKYLEGNYNAAIRDYQTAININAESLDALLGMTLPLLAQQRWREAASFTGKALKIAPWNYYAHVRLMVAEEGQKQWKTLAKHAQQAVAHYPSDATFFVYLARAQAQLGKKQEARAAYRQVLERVPEHLEAMKFLLAK
jgi:tetratricopeptide (TPR) repeat protein